ncbi:prephenate dehydrogenase [Cyclobacteriaceae bacterium]|nr:prephenate dehydrogenase [Cyclobacteriaceae bacterium]HAQ72272.1 prephenate dehydrogenase [Flavobacteriales bacterium]
MKISIIGLGLIGGSYALSLKQRFKNLTLYGWDQNEAHNLEAKNRNLIDVSCRSLEEALEVGDWILLAIPVNSIASSLSGMLDMLAPHQLIIDFGSTKEQICKGVASHKKRDQFIAAHPIAGTEYSGPSAAFSNLYQDKVMIVCESEKTRPNFLSAFKDQCGALDMVTLYLGAAEHDVHLAYVSHLSHIIAFGLSHTVLQKEVSAMKILDLAGSGLASTVRLAKSSPDMWTPIFINNRDAILESLDVYLEKINDFKALLTASNASGIRAYLEKGREIKKILK